MQSINTVKPKIETGFSFTKSTAL